MEWSDSQGLDSTETGAPSTVGGVESSGIYWKIQDLPQWLKDARTKALSKRERKGEVR